ncbi:hypothetical protein RGR602_CH03657 [Rhizobium gallicum bv. gallicum R602sp]|uniref:Uncharacterized protein n=1 Tax=Rhizobium gallicum bv. gallicum R602sp TaxID=1041138 RepID=A0A0B4X4D1_9HYPH|nr:hypothetical protein [Rhizobium sp. SEMIA 4085]AJD42964.1 hypothetical protein RGR602_CH03657 [Rhizobium gallicum bv. gallicum R602sp]
MEQGRNEFTVDINDAWLTCPWWESPFGLSLKRQFHCDAVLFGRRIFAERFDGDVLAPSARRTARLDHIVHHLGLALGGRPAATFAKRLILPVSNDTLLRVVRRRGSPRFVPPTVIGIDDCAWRRNQRYC